MCHRTNRLLDLSSAFFVNEKLIDSMVSIGGAYGNTHLPSDNIYTTRLLARVQPNCHQGNTSGRAGLPIGQTDLVNKAHVDV